MVRIGFVRHGVTRWNKEGRAQGSSDIPLDEEGMGQARLLAARMTAGEWDVLYASDLSRAVQTANILNDKLQTQMYLDDRLREVNGGLIEGTTEDERVQRWGPNWRELDVGFETHESIRSRGLSFIEEICGKHHDQNVLIVSHGSFMKRMFKELMPELDMSLSLKNTSLTTLRESGSGWGCDLYNCTNHLIQPHALDASS